mmetsp:Transcript_13825/g.33259  ORF Transcript_13825/g.33259 Transcript_13825/m.33259 type:complete len:152 (-) Transcript_13825:516-971(-)
MRMLRASFVHSRTSDNDDERTKEWCMQPSHCELNDVDHPLPTSKILSLQKHVMIMTELQQNYPRAETLQQTNTYGWRLAHYSSLNSTDRRHRRLRHYHVRPTVRQECPRCYAVAYLFAAVPATATTTPKAEYCNHCFASFQVLKSSQSQQN